MKRWAFLFAVLAAGCGGDDNPGGMGGGGEVPDGHVQQGCQSDPDCDDGNKCHVPKCSGHVCANQPVMCPAPDACNVGVCQESDGTCMTMTTNEGGACTTMTGAPGACLVGYCQALPTCYPSTSFNNLDCSSSPMDDTNDPAVSFNSPTNVMNNYPCAQNETAPEVAWKFTPAVDGDVTFSITTTAPAAGADAGTPDLKGASPDLDLIVLDGSCTTQATCVNAPLPGGGFQGITAGTGNERVSFHAMLGHTYYVVIDGKNGAIGNYHLTVDSCGDCNAATSTKIACNQSMAVSGDTSHGQSKLSSYTCKSGMTTQMVSAPGREQTFQFTGSAPVTVKATAQVVNASGPVTLLALPTTQGACDPASCAGSALSSGGSASLPFDALPDFSNNLSYWVVVDTTNADATFGLTLSCAPYCNYYYDTVDCTTRSVSGTNDQYGSTNDVSAWGPSTAPCGGMTNLTGSEYVYKLHKATTTNLAKYRFTLASTTAKHLALVIIDAGTTDPASCNPILTCGSTAPVTVAASGTTLASTGTYVAAGPGTTDGGTKGKTAVVDLSTNTLGEHYYWVVVDGVKGEAGSYALSIDSGCP